MLPGISGSVHIRKDPIAAPGWTSGTSNIGNNTRQITVPNPGSSGLMWFYGSLASGAGASVLSLSNGGWTQRAHQYNGTAQGLWTKIGAGESVVLNTNLNSEPFGYHLVLNSTTDTSQFVINTAFSTNVFPSVTLPWGDEYGSLHFLWGTIGGGVGHPGALAGGWNTWTGVQHGSATGPNGSTHSWYKQSPPSASAVVVPGGSAPYTYNCLMHFAFKGT